MRLIVLSSIFVAFATLQWVVVQATAEVGDKITKKINLTPIEHVVVLMMENRSFDHYLGLLKATRPDLIGCLPNDVGCSNPRDPEDPNSTVYQVNSNGINVQASPDHSIHGTTGQIYSHSATPAVADMQGFVRSYGQHTGEDNGPHVMDCLAPEHVPILATLAQEYLLFDGWFSSVPGPTEPNRCYAAAASSHGMATNDAQRMAVGLPNKTLFRQLEEMGLDWRIYFELVPTMLMFKDMRHKDARSRYHPMQKFYTDVAAGDLPQYTWLEPNYYAEPNRPPTDQHPDHNMADGEMLIKKVYESLRAGPLWNKTALVITWDEHGGFFDHVAPPNPVPSPDNITATDDPFDFTRLGVRVPTVVVSPWVSKGALVHAPAADKGQYEHSSLAATVVHKLFAPAEGHPPQRHLNARDAWAATFEHVFTGLTEPRSDADCPLTLPTPYDVAQRPKGYEYSPRPLNDLQEDLLPIVAGATGDSSFLPEKTKGWTDADAVAYIKERFRNYFPSVEL